METLLKKLYPDEKPFFGLDRSYPALLDILPRRRTRWQRFVDWMLRRTPPGPRLIGWRLTMGPDAKKDVDAA